MRVTFRVTGRVQGVGYRAFALDRARGLGLSGWVRNAPDGAVEGVAAGPDPALAAFREALAQGPPWGRVEAVAWRVVDEPPADPSESLPHPFDIHR